MNYTGSRIYIRVYIPASKASKEVADDSIFIIRKVAVPNVGSEIVKPS